MKRGFLLKNVKDTDRTKIEPTQAATKAKNSVVYIPYIKIDLGLDTPDWAHTKFPAPGSQISSLTLPNPELCPYRPGEQKSVCLLHPGAKEAILAIPNFPVPLPTVASPETLYEIRDIPGLGKGAFANVTFQPGDLIMCERPLMIMPIAFPPIAPGNRFTSSLDAIVEDVVNAFDENARQIFYGLHTCKGDSVKQATGIVRTNNFGIGQIPGEYDGMYIAVFRDMSRINHSCTPNVQCRWYLNSMSYHARALRTIQRGEQLFVTYTNVLCPRKIRQEELSTKYAFNCACTSCSLQGPASALSDFRRFEIYVAARETTSVDCDHDIKAWASDPSLPDDYVIRPSLEITNLMEEEGLYNKDLWPVHYTRLCKAYCALEDRKQAIKWAKKSAGLATAFTGDDRGWNKVVDAPENTEWWGLRKKLKQSTWLNSLS